MECGCVKDIFDFNLESRECCKRIFYQDLSQWMDESYDSFYNTPPTYTITIANDRNYSQDFIVSTSGLTEIDFPCEDGVYCFTFTNCDGVKLWRYKLISFEIENRLTCMLSMGHKEEYKDAKMWLNQAKIAVKRGMLDKANEYFEQARYIVDQYDCKCCD